MMINSVRFIITILLICPLINLHAQIIKKEFVPDAPGNFQLSGEIEYPAKGKKFPAAILI